MAMAAYIIGLQKIASLASPRKELLSKDFLSSSRMTSNSEVIHMPDERPIVRVDFRTSAYRQVLSTWRPSLSLQGSQGLLNLVNIFPQCGR
jgi:hypothetical protein